MGMLSEFRQFAMRGNVVDLAIAVVVGAAFTGIITQFTKSFVEPLIKLMGGGGVHGGAFIVNGVAFDWGGFINASINFLIVAAIIYFFIVVPINTLMARRRRGEAPVEAAATTPEDIALLREIRDLLKGELK